MGAAAPTRWRAGEWRRGAKRIAIVGGVELAAKARRPSRGAAERRKQRGRPFDNRQVGGIAQARNGEIRTRQPLERGPRQPDRKPARRARGLLAKRLELRRIVEAKPAGDLLSRSPTRGGQEQKPDAAMNGKHAPVVVDPDDGVDIAAREQHPSKRRAALIGCE